MGTVVIWATAACVSGACCAAGFPAGQALWLAQAAIGAGRWHPNCPAKGGYLTEREALASDCWPAPEVMANVNTDELGNLGLSRAEERAIVAFMGTLSDGYAAAAGPR